MSAIPAPLRALLPAVVERDARALGRALTIVENAAVGNDALQAALPPAAAQRRARRIGITGPPGAGKSTLVDALLAQIVAAGLSVGVVAVDPSSPFTGGAVLGDRTRMREASLHRNVFIRSVASRGAAGGLARCVQAMTSLLEAAGYPIVLVESVGAGQGEFAIADLVDLSVVLCPPGLGDEIQGLKAGILEIADVLVVSKGDLPGSEVTHRELLSALSMTTRPKRPIVQRVSAADGGGMVDLMLALAIPGWAAPQPAGA